MTIDAKLLQDALGRPLGDGLRCATLGLVDSAVPGTLTFLDDERFLPRLASNPNIAAVITTVQLRDRVAAACPLVLESADPRHDFYTVYNHLCRARLEQWPSRIDPGASVHPRAFVAAHNVVIGPGCVIEPLACVMPDVEIGARCIVRAGAVVGTEGYEKKWTRSGVLSVLHAGKVVVHEDVEIGANACVAKGMYLFGDTTIRAGTKINALAFVGHCVSIGRDCLLHLGASVSGGSVVGDRVWIGPKATVSNGLRVGEGARISLGAVVTADVAPGAHVTGNFAVDHATFIANLKRSLARP